MKILSRVLGLVLILSGCVTKDMSRPPFELIPGPEDSARIYVYRVWAHADAAGSPLLMLNNEGMAKLINGSYMMLDVDPGPNKISFEKPYSKLKLTLDAEAGRSYFLKYSVAIGSFSVLPLSTVTFISSETNFHFGEVTEVYALEELRFLDPTDDPEWKLKHRECERLKRVNAELPVYCRPIANTEMLEAAVPTEHDINVSGTYRSSITSNHDWFFRADEAKNMQIELTQAGNKITGWNSDFGVKILGEVSGRKIAFDMLAGKVTNQNNLHGEWWINPNSGLIEGSWQIDHSDQAGAGKWNLLRIDGADGVKSASGVATYAEPATRGIDISGTYLSYITTDNPWYFKKRYQKLKIIITQNENEITVSEPEFGTKIHLALDGNVVSFHVEPGKATGYYSATGQWEIGTRAATLEGSWKAGSGSGLWNLIRIE